jgi:hypothetical protein
MRGRVTLELSEYLRHLQVNVSLQSVANHVALVVVHLEHLAKVGTQPHAQFSHQLSYPAALEKQRWHFLPQQVELYHFVDRARLLRLPEFQKAPSAVCFPCQLRGLPGLLNQFLPNQVSQAH